MEELYFVISVTGLYRPNNVEDKDCHDNDAKYIFVNIKQNWN
jgi:hypothetical protein